MMSATSSVATAHGLPSASRPDPGRGREFADGPEDEHALGVIPPLSASYADARAAFLDAAASANARITSDPHPETGREGEPLFVDVAEVGPPLTDGGSAVVVVSGTHGVEGYLGSALQRHHLETIDADRTMGPTVLFVHALNPYGFSWVRRVNEDNVDLNRNFIDWSEPRPQNARYAEFADALVPDGWTAEVQQQTLGQLMAALEEIGLEEFQQIVSGGQFDHPTGIFYGGTGPTWSHRWLTDFLSTKLAIAGRVAIIDLHTGLGPWGHGELISSERPESEAYLRQTAWWNEVTSLFDGSSVSAELTGDWLGAVGELMPDVELTGVAIEYGTVDPVSVLQSLRADAVLHANGDPSAPEATPIREQVRAAFLDDDPAWLEVCWPRYRSVVTASIERLS